MVWVSKNNVVFDDYSINVKGAIKEKCIRFLHEAGEEVKNQWIRNTRTDTGQTKGSYGVEVDESALAVHIGSDYINAIWEEFGTGEYAETNEGAKSGKGRKGYWVYVKGGSPKSNPSSKVYTLEEAKKVTAILRKKGLDAYYTKGKSATHALRRAFQTTKPKIEKFASSLFGDMKG